MNIEKTKTKKQLNFKIQNVLIITIFVMMILVFVYSLLFMTPFYSLYNLKSYIFLKGNMATYGLALSDYAEEVYSVSPITGNPNGIRMEYFVNFTEYGLQDFNHILFTLGIVGIIVSALLFFFRCHKRKNYYLSNFLILGFNGAMSIGLGAYILSQLITWQNYLTTVDYKTINAANTDLTSPSSTEIVEFFNASSFNWIFVLGFVLCILLFICGAGLLAYLIYKILYQRKHKPIDISGVIIND